MRRRFLFMLAGLGIFLMGDIAWGQIGTVAPAIRFEISVGNSTLVGVPGSGDSGALFLGTVNITSSQVPVVVRATPVTSAPFGTAFRRSAWDMYSYNNTNMSFSGSRTMLEWGEALLGCAFTFQNLIALTSNLGPGDYQVDGSHAIGDPFNCLQGDEEASGLRIVHFSIRCPSCGGGGGGGGGAPSGDEFEPEIQGEN